MQGGIRKFFAVPIPAVQSNVSRQLPLAEFQASHAAEREAASMLYARESGRELAEKLASQGQKFESLSQSDKRKMLKRYLVPESNAKEFFTACAESYQFERYYQRRASVVN
jgi:hypothetical protein